METPMTQSLWHLKQRDNWLVGIWNNCTYKCHHLNDTWIAKNAQIRGSISTYPRNVQFTVSYHISVNSLDSVRLTKNKPYEIEYGKSGYTECAKKVHFIIKRKHSLTL